MVSSRAETCEHLNSVCLFFCPSLFSLPSNFLHHSLLSYLFPLFFLCLNCFLSLFIPLTTFCPPSGSKLLHYKFCDSDLIFYLYFYLFPFLICLHPLSIFFGFYPAFEAQLSFHFPRNFFCVL